MKIATYNVNGVNGRLPVLLRWLREAQPDIVCLQELKAPQEKFTRPRRRPCHLPGTVQGLPDAYIYAALRRCLERTGSCCG